jgi:hypothetical protein
MTAGRTGDRPRVGDVAVPVDVTRPFTRRAGLATGLTDEQLQSTAYRRIFRGVYADAATLVTAPARLEAARLIGPADAFATHHTAARLLGGIVPDTPVTHLGTTSQRRGRVTDLRVHRYAALPPLVRIAGQLVTAPTQTFLDLAGSLDLVDLVVLGDSLVNAGQIVPRTFEPRAPPLTRGGRGRHDARRHTCVGERSRRLRLGCGCSSCWRGCLSRRRKCRCSAATGGCSIASTWGGRRSKLPLNMTVDTTSNARRNGMRTCCAVKTASRASGGLWSPRRRTSTSVLTRLWGG